MWLEDSLGSHQSNLVSFEQKSLCQNCSRQDLSASFDFCAQKAECLQPDLLIKLPSVHRVFIVVGGIVLLVTLHRTGKERVQIATGALG